MTENAFRARDIGLRAQKKILSRMATKTIAKTFIDGTTASLLDNIYRLAKLHVSLIIHPHLNTSFRVTFYFLSKSRDGLMLMLFSIAKRFDILIEVKLIEKLSTNNFKFSISYYNL